jgi:hypothetical protein
MYKYTLKEPFTATIPELRFMFFRFKFGNVQGKTLTIYNGYSWNGCTAVPDYKETYNASLLHDFLYQYKPVKRAIADRIFYNQLKADGFKAAGLYYAGVRLFGIFFY